MTARSKKSTHPKDNAKGRRKKENKELLDLASQLPLPVTVATQLDKASIIRLATAYLKLRRLFPQGLGRCWGENISSASDVLPEMGKFLNKAFHGFVFILGADATILYISEEASAQLGFSQVQLTGKSFWSYVHSGDAKDLKNLLCFEMDIPAFNVGNSILEDLEVPTSFTVRMNCILPKRQAELAIDRYKVIHCRGYVKLKRKCTVWDGSSDLCYEMTGVVASGQSLSPTPCAEIKLHRGDFMFRTGLNLQFLYIEPISQKMIGYEPTQLQDKSLYKFIHPCDCEQMKQVHQSAVMKSQAVSSYYRFLTQNGGWIWMQSSCIVITNNKTDNNQCILFVNSVLSEREYTNTTLAVEQVATQDNKQCNNSKRCGMSFKKRKKTPSMNMDDSLSSNQNSENASPYEISDQGLDNNHYLNHASGFAQKSNSFEFLRIVNTPELNSDNCAAISGTFNVHGLCEYPVFSYLESTINSTEFRRNYHCANHAPSSELDDSEMMVIQNLTAESSPTSIALISENEQETLYSTSVNNTNDSNLESYKVLNPCIPITSIEECHINNPSQTDLITTNLNYLSQKSNRHLVNSCNPSSPTVGETDDIGESNIFNALSDANQLIKQDYYFVPQGKCSKEAIHANSDEIGEDEAVNLKNCEKLFQNYSEYDLSNQTFNDDNHFNALSSKIALSGDSGLIENAMKTHHDNNDPKKSFDLTSKTTYDNGCIPMIISTVEQSILRVDDTNAFYVLSNLTNDPPFRMNCVTTQTSTFSDFGKHSNTTTLQTNNTSLPIATASSSTAMDDCSNELSTPYSFKFDASGQVLTETSTVSSSMTNTKSNYSLTSNVTEVPVISTNSIHDCTVIGNEYLSFLNDQWTALYSQSATNARSDSASSVSLGYASESSYMDRSSPFSTYGESSFN